MTTEEIRMSAEEALNKTSWDARGPIYMTLALLKVAEALNKLSSTINRPETSSFGCSAEGE